MSLDVENSNGLDSSSIRAKIMTGWESKTRSGPSYPSPRNPKSPRRK